MEHATIGLISVRFVFSSRILYRGVPSFATDFFRCLISWIKYLPHVCWSTSVVIICRHKLKFTLRIFTFLSLRCFVTSDYLQYAVPIYRWKWIIYHICVFLHSIFKRDYDNCRRFEIRWFVDWGSNIFQSKPFSVINCKAHQRAPHRVKSRKHVERKKCYVKSLSAFDI